jgi:hypothetical protein
MGAAATVRDDSSSVNVTGSLLLAVAAGPRPLPRSPFMIEN